MSRAGVGFGRSRFGESPFGYSDWGRRVTWEFLPQYDRDADAGELEAFSDVMSDLFTALKRKVDKIPDLLDPLACPSSSTGAVSVAFDATDFVTAAASDDGRAYVSALAASGQDLGDSSPDWTVDDGTTQYEIRAVDKFNGVVEFYAESDVSTLTLTLRPPTMLRHLAADIGADFDGHEPEANQRATIKAWHYLSDIRGSKEAIEVRAAMAGFEAEVLHLFRVTDLGVVAGLGADAIEIPESSGRYYTGVEPVGIQFDMTPADVAPLDVQAAVPVTITPVSGSAGAWLFGVSPMVGIGWSFESGGVTYRVSSVDVDNGRCTFDSVSQPPTGAHIFTPWIRVLPSCSYCPTHKLRVVLTIGPSLTSPRQLESAFARMVKKIDRILPAHVEVVQYVFVSAHGATLTIEGNSLSITATAILFDETPADDETLDTFTNEVV